MKHRAALRRLAHILIERDGVDAIVLAGTELALVFDTANTDTQRSIARQSISTASCGVALLHPMRAAASGVHFTSPVPPRLSEARPKDADRFASTTGRLDPYVLNRMDAEDRDLHSRAAHR